MKKYNIREFLEFANIGGYRNNHIHLAEFNRQQTITMKQESIRLDFYLLVLKRNFSNGEDACQICYDQSNAYVFVKQPGDGFQWNVDKPIFGYHILIDAVLLRQIAKEFSFSRDSNDEILVITKSEEKVVGDLFRKALREFERNEDFSKEIAISYVSLILTYIQKFYSRQFDKRAALYNATVADFYKNLENYYTKESKTTGIPTVSYFSERANLSSNYFGDLIKHYTGRSPQEHIHQLIIENAKEKLKKTSLSISEIAFHLGFEYPSYFSTFFKKETGISPSEFRSQ